MPTGDVRLSLHDGEALIVDQSDVERVYENLWGLAPMPGALMLAGILVAASRANSGRWIDLTEEQSAVIRKAISMPDK